MRSMSSESPSWLVKPCPTWCVIDHQDADYVEDRVHESEALEVPGVARRRVPYDGATTTEVEAVGIYLVRYRWVADAQDWVVLGTASEYLDMSWETAQRIERALSRLLEQGVC